MASLKFMVNARVFACGILLALVGVALAADQGAKPQAAALDGVNAAAREILTQHCVKCQAGRRPRGNST